MAARTSERSRIVRKVKGKEARAARRSEVRRSLYLPEIVNKWMESESSKENQIKMKRKVKGKKRQNLRRQGEKKRIA